MNVKENIRTDITGDLKEAQSVSWETRTRDIILVFFVTEAQLFKTKY